MTQPPSLEAPQESPPTPTFDAKEELKEFMAKFSADTTKKDADTIASDWTKEQLAEVRDELKRQQKVSSGTETPSIERASKRLAEIAQEKINTQSSLKELKKKIPEGLVTLPSIDSLNPFNALSKIFEQNRGLVNGVLAGGLAVSIVLLLRRLWNGSKKVVEKGKETVKKGFGWLWGMLGIGTVALGTYFGIKSITDKYSKEISTLKSQADKAKELGERAVSIAEERKKQLESQLRLLGAKIPEVEKVVKEKAGDGAERALVSGPAKMLVSFFGSEVLQTRPQVMEDVLAAIKTKNITMKQVFDAKNTLTLKNLDLPPPSEGGDNNNIYSEALEIVLENCQKNKQRMTKLYVKKKPKKDINDVLCFDYIREAGGGGALLHTIFENLKKGDIHSLDIRALTEGAKDEIGPLTGAVMATFAHERYTKDADKALKEKAGSMNYFSFITNASNVGTVATMRNNIPKTDDEKILHAIIESLPTAKILLPYFHKIFPDKYYDPNDDEKNIQVIGQYLSEMKVDQALRVFFAHRMLESGNPIGAMWLQCEILHFINSRDPGWNIFGLHIPMHTLGKEAAISVAKSVTSGAFTQALVEGKYVEQEVANHYGESMKKAMRYIAKAGAVATFVPGLQAASTIIALGKQNPEISTGVALGTGAFSIWSVAELYDKFLHSRRDFLGATEVFQKYRKGGARNWIATNVLRMRYDRYTYARIYHVFEELSKHVNDEDAAETLDIAFKKYIRNQGTSKALEEFFDEAKKITNLTSDSHLFKNIDRLLQNEKALAALAKHFRPLRYYAGTYGLPIAGGLLGLYQAAAEDVPEMFAAWQENETLKDEGKFDRAEIVNWQARLHTAKAITHGAAVPIYLTYARWGMRNARWGMRGTLVVGLATEAAFTMADASLEALEDLVQRLDSSLSESAQLSFAQLESQMRGNTIGRVELGNTQDNEHILFKKAFSAYLLKRLYAKAKAGDTNARIFLESVSGPKGKEGEEIRGSDNAQWEWYVQFAWRTILRNNPTAQTSAELIKNMEGSLQEADFGAKVDLDAREYNSLKRNVDTLMQRSIALEKELSELRKAIKQHEENNDISVLSPFTKLYSLDEASPDFLAKLKETRDGLNAEGLELQSELSMNAECLEGMSTKTYLQNQDGSPPLTLANIIDPPEYADEETESRQASLMNFEESKKTERDAELLKLGKQYATYQDRVLVLQGKFSETSESIAFAWPIKKELEELEAVERSPDNPYPTALITSQKALLQMAMKISIPLPSPTLPPDSGSASLQPEYNALAQLREEILKNRKLLITEFLSQITKNRMLLRKDDDEAGRSTHTWDAAAFYTDPNVITLRQPTSPHTMGSKRPTQQQKLDENPRLQHRVKDIEQYLARLTSYETARAKGGEIAPQQPHAAA